METRSRLERLDAENMPSIASGSVDVLHFNRRACGLLGVSSASVLDRAGYSDSESQAVMERLGETSDEEIASEPL